MNSLILKNETKQFHDNIERVMSSSLLFSNQFTQEHYKNFLLKSYYYITAISEKTNIHWPEYTEILKSKNKALMKDLQHIHVDDVSNNATFISKNEKYYQLGLIYIILGAMMGNKIILKKLNENTDFQNFPFSYLSKQQENFSELWKNFQNTINELEAQELAKVIEGAKDGYVLFGK